MILHLVKPFTNSLLLRWEHLRYLRKYFFEVSRWSEIVEKTGKWKMVHHYVFVSVVEPLFLTLKWSVI